ncbi:MAG TPA: hypothetical protein VHX15_13250 [Frankiaceae bacterium]|nr:hypothetical protein [Frankiaceae bacterium]
MKKTAAALTLAALLSACSSSHKSAAGPGPSAGSSAPDGSVSSPAPNPVNVLRKTGAVITAETVTDRGNGAKQAMGQFFATARDKAAGNGERITVVTYPSDAERTASGDVPNASDDAHWYITVDRTLITVTGVEDAASHSVVFALPAQTIASRVGGHLIPRG